MLNIRCLHVFFIYLHEMQIMFNFMLSMIATDELSFA